MRPLSLFTFALVVSVFGQQLSYGQQFKDPSNLGPDMPTPQTVVDLMLKSANVKPDEVVYDLGCGDGRILITAAQQYRARGVGVEMSRDIFDKTTAKVKALGLDGRIQILHENALRTNLKAADVVTLYLLTDSNNRLKPMLATLHPGARVVSHDYEIPGWKPLEINKVTANSTVHTIYLYRTADR